MEENFESRMYDIYRQWKEAGYVSHRFLEKVRHEGSVQAASEMVVEGTTTGFLRLLRHRKLELTLEAQILQFQDLFAQEVRDRASHRMELARELLAA